MSVSFYASTISCGNNDVIPLRSGRVVVGPNWTNLAAVSLLQLLGLPCDDIDLTGEIDIHTVLCAITYARSRFDSLVSHYVFAPIDEERFYIGGLDEDGIRRRLDDFVGFVVEAQRLGAKSVYWC